MANTLNNIGSIYQSLYQPENAIDYYEKSLNIKKKVCGGEDHPEVGDIYNNIGLVNQIQSLN